MKSDRVFKIVKDTANGWVDDNAFRLSAALAFYTIFSLAPLIIIAVAMAGIFLGREAAARQLGTQFEQLIGHAGAETAQQLLASANHPHAGLVATAISVVTLLSGALAVVSELQDGLNGIWHVKPRPGRVLRKLVRDRLFSFALVVSLGFLLLVSLVIGAVLSAVGNVAQHVVPHPLSGFTMELIHTGATVAIDGALFGLIFKTLPDVHLRWRDVFVGGIVTAVLFAVGRVLIGLYLGHAAIGTPFGAAGSLVVMLVWVYYSSLIVYLGAEFTRAWTLSLHGPVPVSELAMRDNEPLPARSSVPHPT